MNIPWGKENYFSNQIEVWRAKYFDQRILKLAGKTLGSFIR
jgi:hypothetical protein